MRTYKIIYAEYCNWLVKRTGKQKYSYENMLEEYGEQNTDVMLYTDLLKKFYDKKLGLYYFCKFMIGGLSELGYPSPFRYNTLLHTWDNLIKSTKHLCIAAARGHGKSMFFSQILSLYDMFLYKFKRIILISANQDQANELLENLKLIVENNEWLVTKKNPGKWATTRVGYNNGYIMTAGIGSEILGQHVDRIVVDDILRTDNKLTDQQIEDYIDMNLSPMLLNRKGQIIIVGTVKTEKDIFSTILQRISESKECPWSYERYPAILDYDKRILQCPDRFTWDQLMEKRLTMGPLKFGREYQLEFFSRDKSLFPKRIVSPSCDKGKELTLLDNADNRGYNIGCI